MEISERTKSVDYFKENLDEMIEEVNNSDESFFITQDGKPKAVLISMKSYEQAEAMALHIILKMREREIREGKGIPAEGMAEEIIREIELEYGIQSNSYSESQRRSA